MFNRISHQPLSYIAMVCAHGTVNDVKALVKNGAAFHISESELPFSEVLLEREKGFQTTSYPLMEAVHALNVDVVEYLLSQGLCNVNDRDSSMKTAFDYLVTNKVLHERMINNHNINDHKKAIQIFECLIRYGANAFEVSRDGVSIQEYIYYIEENSLYSEHVPAFKSDFITYITENLEFDETVDISSVIFRDKVAYEEDNPKGEVIPFSFIINTVKPRPLGRGYKV